MTDAGNDTIDHIHIVNMLSDKSMAITSVMWYISNSTIFDETNILIQTSYFDLGDFGVWSSTKKL